jgi:hypothetical protein
MSLAPQFCTICLVAGLEWLTGQMKAQFGLNSELKTKTDIQL